MPTSLHQVWINRVANYEEMQRQTNRFLTAVHNHQGAIVSVQHAVGVSTSGSPFHTICVVYAGIEAVELPAEQ